MMDNRGPLDLTKQIDDLKENKELLEGKVKFLQETCRRAGAQIKKLESELKEATQWKEDEVEAFASSYINNYYPRHFQAVHAWG